MDETELKLSSEKTRGLVLKGRLDQTRPPRVSIAGGRISFGATNKYLEITLDGKMSFLPHVKEVSGKAKRLFGKVVRLSRLNYETR